MSGEDRHFYGTQISRVFELSIYWPVKAALASKALTLFPRPQHTSPPAFPHLPLLFLSASPSCSQHFMEI